MAPSGVLVFDHLPKTAGTTFRRSYLTCALPREERWILSGGEDNERDRAALLALPPRKRQRLRVIAGHQAESLRPHLPGARFITLVRDPVERLVSAYLHARFHEGGDALWAPVRRENLGLAAFVERYERPNGQCLRLLGDDYQDLDADAVRQRLASRYVLAGYTEAFAEFVFLLHVTEGLPLCLFNNRLVRAERQSYVPPPADLEALRTLNAADARLHAIVRQEFLGRIDRLQPGQRDRLGQYVAALRAFQADTREDVAAAVLLDEGAKDGPFRHLVPAVSGTADRGAPVRTPRGASGR